MEGDGRIVGVIEEVVGWWGGGCVPFCLSSPPWSAIVYVWLVMSCVLKMEQYW